MGRERLWWNERECKAGEHHEWYRFYVGEGAEGGCVMARVIYGGLALPFLWRKSILGEYRHFRRVGQDCETMRQAFNRGKRRDIWRSQAVKELILHEDREMDKIEM